MLTHAEVSGSPPYGFTRTNKTACHSADCLLSRLFCPEQMNFDAAGEVEASLNRRSDPYTLLDRNHNTRYLSD
jgi:hypothetical protein